MRAVSDQFLAQFAAAWERSFLLAPPLSYAMQRPYVARWLRVHSLPDSKRYPETAADYAEVLARHNAVASALFAEGEPVAYVTAAYGDAAGPYPAAGRADPPAPLTAPPAPLRRLDPRELDRAADPALDPFVYLDAAPAAWRAGAFDALIRATADDAGPRWLLASADAGRVYAPYDGGADLFLPTQRERDTWRARFGAWLSAEPSGL